MRVPQLFDLSGRTALVTGGARGLGRHITRGLSEAGAHVLLASRDGEVCQEFAREIESEGGRASAFAADLSKPEQIDPIVEKGFTFIALSSDGGILMRGLCDTADAFAKHR